MIKIENCKEKWATCQSCGNKENLKWIKIFTNASSSISTRLCEDCLNGLFEQLNYKQYYTVKEVAEMLRVHENTILKHIRQAKLRTCRVGNFHRITPTQLSKYLRG